MSHRTQVLEYSSPKPEGSVVKGVKIIGTQSKNGYTYPVSVLQEAMPLYEGAPVFIAHPNGREQKRGSRQLSDHFGTLQAVRERQNGKGVYGDLHVKPSHPMAKSVLESIAESKFGLSHNAIVLMNEDETEVTKILEINSVDLVDDPATTTNLFEEEEMSKEFQDAVMTKLEALSAKVDKIEAQAVTEEIKPLAPKDKRLSALEKLTPVEGAPAPIGNTHENFLETLRGFAVTN